MYSAVHSLVGSKADSFKVLAQVFRARYSNMSSIIRERGPASGRVDKKWLYPYYTYITTRRESNPDCSTQTDLEMPIPSLACQRPPHRLQLDPTGRLPTSRLDFLCNPTGNHDAASKEGHRCKPVQKIVTGASWLHPVVGAKDWIVANRGCIAGLGQAKHNAIMHLMPIKVNICNCRLQPTKRERTRRWSEECEVKSGEPRLRARGVGTGTDQSWRQNWSSLLPIQEAIE